MDERDWRLIRGDGGRAAIRAKLPGTEPPESLEGAVHIYHDFDADIAWFPRVRPMIWLANACQRSCRLYPLQTLPWPPVAQPIRR